METRPRIVCGVDFSESSGGALRVAAILSQRFQRRLTVATIEHPLLASLAEGGSGNPDLDVGRMLRRFVSDTLVEAGPQIAIDSVVRVGNPADELLRLARNQGAELIVMSSHGLTGVRKLFFGSTTERLLRQSDIPVLVTAPARCRPGGWDALRSAVQRILVPVDLLDGTESQLLQAAQIGESLGAPLVVMHVIAPMSVPLLRRHEGLRIDAERRAAAERAIDALVTASPGLQHPECLVVHGDPAEQIARVARDREAGLIVVGMRAGSSPAFRMGSVTYRVLCTSHVTVLALPPHRTRPCVPGPGAIDVAAGEPSSV